MNLRANRTGLRNRALVVVRSAITALTLGQQAACSSAGDTFNPMIPPHVSSQSLTTRVETFENQALSAQARYESDVDDRSRTQARDQVIANRLLAYDLVFEDFAWNAWGADATAATASDWIVLGLTAAGSLASAGATQALSATAAAVTGAKTSLQKNFLYAKTIDQLIFAMTVNRSRIRTHILSCMQNPDSSYSLGVAMVDIEQYKQAAILPLAIANLSASSDDGSTRPCSSTLSISTIDRVKTSSTELISAYLRPNGVLNRDRQLRLQNWMQTQSTNPALREAPVEELRSAPQFEADRQQAIRDLKI